MTQPTDRPGINQLRQRLARAIHRYDNHHALSGNDTPSEHHYGEADAALAELERELSAFAEYENAINWMTTCLSCARVLDSSIRETERAEQAEATLEQAELDAEQQERNYRVLMNERTSYREGWKYEQKRRAKAEATLTAVRAIADRWAESDVEVLRRAALVLAKEALDQHGQTPKETADHIGGSAEDCPACEGTNPPYPFICPGPTTKD